MVCFPRPVIVGVEWTRLAVVRGPLCVAWGPSAEGESRSRPDAGRNTRRMQPACQAKHPKPPTSNVGQLSTSSMTTLFLTTHHQAHVLCVLGHCFNKHCCLPAIFHIGGRVALAPRFGSSALFSNQKPAFQISVVSFFCARFETCSGSSLRSLKGREYFLALSCMAPRFLSLTLSLTDSSRASRALLIQLL